MSSENTSPANVWACQFRVKDSRTKKWGEWKTEQYIPIELITGCQQEGKDHVSYSESEQEDLGWMRALRWKHCTERHWGSGMECRVVLHYFDFYEDRVGRVYKLDTVLSTDYL